jgi:hypothetical protein
MSDDAAAPAAEAAPDPLDALVDRWFAETMHNSIVSRDTETHNHVHAAVAELKRRLKER